MIECIYTGFIFTRTLRMLCSRHVSTPGLYTHSTQVQSYWPAAILSGCWPHRSPSCFRLGSSLRAVGARDHAGHIWALRRVHINVRISPMRMLSVNVGSFCDPDGLLVRVYMLHGRYIYSEHWTLNCPWPQLMHRSSLLLRLGSRRPVSPRGFLFPHTCFLCFLIVWKEPNDD
jgi:hypothetical protein